MSAVSGRRGVLKRLWPASLAGRMVALLLLAIVLVQLVTVWLLSDERRAAIQSAGREQILERTASLVHLLEEAPAGMRGQLLAAAGSLRLRFSVTAFPLVPEPRHSGLDDIAAGEMNALLGTARDVHFRIAPVDERDFRPPLRGYPPPSGFSPGGGAREPRLPDLLAGPAAGPPPPPPDEAGGPPPPPPFRPAGLVVSLSVPLAGGQWLNAHTALPPVASYARTTVISSIVMALAVLGAAVLMARQITRPLRALAAAADRLGRGGDAGVLPEQGPEEVRRTIHAFNTMQQRIDRFVNDRMRMLGAVSHDLRTPLTAMRLRAEFIDDEEIRDRMVDGIDEMVAMTQAVLAFVRDDAAAEEARPYDIMQLVAVVADDFSDLGAVVTLDGPPGIVVPLRAGLFKSAVRNLVQNAIRYGDEAQIAVARGDGQVTITVRDKGAGHTGRQAGGGV